MSASKRAFGTFEYNGIGLLPTFPATVMPWLPYAPVFESA